MPSRKGQVLSLELLMASSLFFIATAIIMDAHSQASAGLATAAMDPYLSFQHAFSQHLLFSADASNWSYADHSSGEIALSSAQGLNLTKAANFVSLLYDDGQFLQSLQLGNARLGISVTGPDGLAVNATCPGCSCGGRCSVPLDYAPPGPFTEASSVSRAARLVSDDGTGAGVAVVRLGFYAG